MNELREYKFVLILVLRFPKTINEDEIKYSTFYSNSEAETITQSTNIDGAFKSTYSPIMTKISKYQAEGSGWTIDSVTEQNSI